MENSSQKIYGARRRTGSMDGFVSSKPAQPKNPISPSVKPLSKTPAPSNNLGAMPAKPIASPPKRAPNVSNEGSLIGTTISGYQARPASQTPRSQKPKKEKKHKKTKRAFLVLILLILLIGGFIAFKGISTLDKVFHGNIFSDIGAAFNNTPLKGESTGRVNILLAGDSADDLGHSGAQLTDSILVLSINTKNDTAMMLSIPRDLWVDIPGYGWQKINAANNGYGTNFPGYPQNGMGQLEHIVTTDLGIPIDYYALSDYGAFKDAVNAVGGVTVTINSPDPRGLYDPYTNLKMPNGQVTLNGQTALNLARSRGDGPGAYGFPDSDFDRTQHQREIFTAVAQKAASVGVLSNPAKISDLFNAVGNNVQTDLSLQNILRLVQISKKINLNNIKSYSYCSTIALGQNGCTKAIITGYTDPASGAEALVPVLGLGNYTQLQEFYQQLTSDNPVVKENASVSILNASDVTGLAKAQGNILGAKGMNVVAEASASNTYPSTMIVDNSKGAKPYSLKLLQEQYPGSTVIATTGSAEAREATGYTSDFVVILGQNWDSTVPSTNQ